MRFIQVDRESERLLKRTLRRNQDKLKYIVTSIAVSDSLNMISVNVNCRDIAGDDLYQVEIGAALPDGFPDAGPPMSMLIWKALGMIGPTFGIKLKL